MAQPPKLKISLRSVTKTFSNGRVTALRDIDLDVHEGEFLTLVGPSGCGKTTLLRIIDGLIRPDKGDVLLDGQPVTGPTPKVAMVFQHFGLMPWKTVTENVEYGLKLQGVPPSRRAEIVARYIHMVQLHGFEDAYPYQLSGGMQQRVGLARALAVNPEVLLMDEPFGALDAQSRELLQEELLGIYQREKKTIVFITHDISEAILLGDRVVVMYPRPGRIDEIIPIDLPRPRDPDAVRVSAYLADLRKYIWAKLKSQARNGSPGSLP